MRYAMQGAKGSSLKLHLVHTATDHNYQPLSII
jgi:hypothetical protein